MPCLLTLMMVLLLSLCSSVLHAHGSSLYDEKTYRPLTADSKAYRLGDVLTVQVLESASASTNSDTSTRRKNSLSGTLQHGDHRAAAELSVAGDFDGGGRTQRNGKLLAQLSVTVTEVLPNGDLLVAGDQLLILNEERQRISLEGRVRPQDISDGNLLLSNRLANARITYLGDGDLSERQKRSWWRRFADWMGF
jgi:flagellar L-ring protein precursor FlgH